MRRPGDPNLTIGLLRLVLPEKPEWVDLEPVSNRPVAQLVEGPGGLAPEGDE